MAYSTSVLVIFTIFVAGIFSYPLDNKPENDTTKDAFRPVALPTDFGSYDPNANGYIDLEELAKVTGTTLDDARKPFMDADIDDDDQVSPAEFEKAPWSLSVLNREEVVSEDDNDDDDEEEQEQVDDDGEEEAPPMDESDDGSDDDDEETPVSETDEEEAPRDDSDEVPTDESDDDRAEVDESDYEEADIFDNADDMLVDVGKYAEGDGDDTEKSPVEKSNEDEDNEKASEEYDSESQNIENDEEAEENDDAVDPLVVEKEDPLLKQQDVISENEFVENAIF